MRELRFCGEWRVYLIDGHPQEVQIHQDEKTGTEFAVVIRGTEVCEVYALDGSEEEWEE